MRKVTIVVTDIHEELPLGRESEHRPGEEPGSQLGKGEAVARTAVAAPVS
jgi:hypothetical protein